MFKHKSPVKKLSLAIALSLIAGTASATSVTVYDTYKYLFNPDGSLLPVPSGTELLGVGDWAGGYLSVSSSTCPNGCDITGASLLLDGLAYNPLEDSPFDGATLEVYSSQSGPVPGVSLFQLDTPATVRFDGTFGTRIQFTAASPDLNAPALFQPGEEYWLKLTNTSQSPDFSWFFNGTDKAGEHWASSQFGSGSGTPFIFDITGETRAVSNVPVPGAAWLMGSALIGLLTAKRRKID